MNNKFFSEEEKLEIYKTVEEIESKYAIELVPTFAEKCDGYWKTKFFLFVFGCVISTVLIYFYTQHPAYVWSEKIVFFGLMAAFPFGFMLTISEIDFLFSKLIRKSIKTKNCSQVAASSFYKFGVSQNKDRVGVLVLFSYFEREIHLLIAPEHQSKFNPESWKKVVENAGLQMKNLKGVNAITEAIKELSIELENYPFLKENLSDDSLNNDLRFHEE